MPLAHRSSAMAERKHTEVIERCLASIMLLSYQQICIVASVQQDIGAVCRVSVSVGCFECFELAVARLHLSRSLV